MEERVTASRRARLASWLLVLVAPAADVDVIVGDLEEEYASRSPAGIGAPWYWGQVMRSLPALLWLPIQQSGWLSAFAIGAAACAVQIAIEISIGLAVRQFAPPDARWPTALMVLVILASVAVLGHCATRLRAGGGTALALVAAMIVALQVVLDVAADRGVAPGTLVALFVAPTLALAGARLGRTTAVRSRRTW